MAIDYYNGRFKIDPKTGRVSKFPEKLAELRKERGLSQKNAAADLGVSQALLSHYEKGIRECGLDFVIRCSHYYGVTTDYILGVTDKRLGAADSTFDDIETECGDDANDILQGVKTMLEILYSTKNEKVTDYVIDYCTLCAYRGAITMAKSGLLPKNLFRLDYTLGRELVSASMALQDVKFALIDDKSRSGTDLSDNTDIKNLIRKAEKSLASKLILE